MMKKITLQYLLAAFLMHNTNISKVISDETYIKLIFRGYIGKKLDLKNPKTYNEKFQYFGEMTFSHMSGFAPFIPEKWDYTFGEWRMLPDSRGVRQYLIYIFICHEVLKRQHSNNRIVKGYYFGKGSIEKMVA